MRSLVSVAFGDALFAQSPGPASNPRRRVGVSAGILAQILLSAAFPQSGADESGAPPNNFHTSLAAAPTLEKPPAPVRIRVYLASPLGFAESTRMFMAQRLVPQLTVLGLEIENPWDVPKQLANSITKAKAEKDLDTRHLAWRKVVRQLGSRNAQLIRNAQGVVAVLDGVDVDSGTAAEIGYATALGKWVIGYRGDYRRTGENEAAEVNLQVEYFILESGGTIAHSLEDLKEAVQKRTERP